MIERTTVESAVVEILGEVLAEPVEGLHRNPVLATHRWDSVAVLEALVHLENHFEITMDLRAFQAALRVEDLVALVMRSPTRSAVDQLP